MPAEQRVAAIPQWEAGCRPSLLSLCCASAGWARCRCFVKGKGWRRMRERRREERRAARHLQGKSGHPGWPLPPCATIKQCQCKLTGA